MSPEGDRPTVLVFRTAGTNCEAEMCRAFDLAGGATDLVHIDVVARDPSILGRADILGFPGGFSYGDDIASGRIMASRLRAALWPALADAVTRGALMIGACNGFQVMAQLGLLPGPIGGDGGWSRDRSPAPRVSLAHNAEGRFIDTWVGVAAEPASPCVWTAPLLGSSDEAALMLPVAHGEGRLVLGAPQTASLLERGGHVALRYRENPNGSTGDIAGICDATGRILGLMPHPERYLDWTRHPWWTRLSPSQRVGDAPGLRMFKAAIAATRTRGGIATQQASA